MGWATAAAAALTAPRRTEVARGDWEGKRFELLEGVDNLTDCGGRLPPGKILAHHSGNFILNCPACGAMQFTTGKLSGAPSHPTIDRVVHCGAGICKRCGVYFRIEGGAAKPDTAPQEAAPRDIPDKLKKAGVHKSPSLADEIRKVTESRG